MPQQGQIAVNSSLVMIALAAIGWTGTRIYESFRDWQHRTAKALDRKDEDESLVMGRFIDYTLKQNETLIQGYRDGVKELASKVQGSMQSQASMHLAYTEELGRVSGKLDKLHSRLDKLELQIADLTKVLGALLQYAKNPPNH